MADTVYLLLGSNLGHRERHLAAARDRLATCEGLEIVAASPVYITKAVEVDDEQPAFLNQVIKAEFVYTPTELLRDTEMIETELGRTDKGAGLPRTIDIDILLFGERIIDSDRLTVPHARLTERPFALVPLLAIDPDLCDPQSGKPLSSFIVDTDHSEVMMYEDHVSRNV
jgi:2-amino-4-hydroxy-6-hydroxymethyldihydropteridine diphosphokinase